MEKIRYRKTFAFLFFVLLLTVQLNFSDQVLQAGVKRSYSEFQKILEAANSAGNENIKNLKFADYLWKKNNLKSAALEFHRFSWLAISAKNEREQILGTYSLEYAMLCAYSSNDKIQTQNVIDSAQTIISNYKYLNKDNSTTSKNYINIYGNLLLGDISFRENKYFTANKHYHAAKPKHSNLIPYFKNRLFINKYFIKQRNANLLAFVKKQRIPATLAETELLNQYTLLRNAYISKERHSEAAAVTLAALIPGAGHFYNDFFTNGIISFFSVAVLSGLSFWALGDNSAALAIFLGAGAVAFYGGNIYGAYKSTSDYNKKHDEEFLYQLKINFWKRLELSK